MNINRVSAKQWRKWSPSARDMFNNVFADMRHCGKTMLLHPDTVKRQISDAEFKTIIWNAAWIAADQINQPRTTSASAVRIHGARK